MEIENLGQKAVEAFSSVKSALIRFHRIDRALSNQDDKALDFEEIFAASAISTMASDHRDSDVSDDVDTLTSQVANALTIIHYVSKTYAYDSGKQLNSVAMARVSEAIFSIHHEFSFMKEAYSAASKRQHIYRNRSRLAQSVQKLFQGYQAFAEDANRWIALYNSDHQFNQIVDEANRSLLPIV